MTSYPFIEETFKAILQHSNTIKGRFVICPRFGSEINDENFDQVLEEEVKPITKGKYPVCLGMPPVSYGNYTKSAEHERYGMVLFFLKQTYTNADGTVQFPNLATGTSKHTVPMDWHDMRRAAVNFLRILDRLTRRSGPMKIKHDFDKTIRPVSFLGKDRLSGVRLDFSIAIEATDCETEDYSESDIASIELPATDSHPEHKM